VVSDLDHVAIACRDVTPVLEVLVSELGCEVLFGGANFGFRAMQLDCGDLRIELLEPYNPETNDFLERFLDANGDGPHHLTFKVVDIEPSLARGTWATGRSV
jgi:catechol 2,3-dioxygenase-like lactoylglutathione lyase family enzyme